jgi:hypothetical protein
MMTDPDQIRAHIDAVLAELPDPDNDDHGPAYIYSAPMARRLSDAHDMLVRALESAGNG